MSIHYQQWGNVQAREQILLIHGWGMNSGVWCDIAEYLEELLPEHLIRAVDLPGYGKSATLSLQEYSSQTLAQSIEPLLENKQTTIIAWSMGALVAIEMLNGCDKNSCDENSRNENSAESPSIDNLILVGATPKFVQDNDWPHAVEARIFEEFSRGLVNDHQATLRRFLAIQALGSRTARDDIKTLQAQLFVRGEPDTKALEQGLNILLREDKRQPLAAIRQIPISLIAGEKDTLAPFKVQQQLALQENITLYSIPSAGHAPFISHPEAFKQILAKVL
ncbi:alpha/beta fold hydrolase [sulfur-oxidizing endosymbiont of Gigantopelta aegis]|uniref:alpha/beta fold hydrolase n=1 Tax=sulfur-oxidizing endosymbiont of Gigantopelta aegis TaxID=2794934 RepID=UPI0018DC972B|nr:alpha/beta fold hydrolase [sulfur-oxidizing endosymbiont of Gigantopelta aegis]